MGAFFVEVNMKRLLSLVFVVICLFCFSSCAKNVTYIEEENIKHVVINASENYDNLINYMQKLANENQLTYSVKNGMIEQINNIENSDSEGYYWMLYTDDVEHKNSAWGKIILNEKTYESSTLGAESLPVKKGCTYVWAYQKV